MTTLKLILAAGVAAVALGSAAHAQDLVIADAPAGVVAGNWDGGFVGVFGGGALSEMALDAPEFGPMGELLQLSPNGMQLGVDAGFNFSLGNGLVLGVVGDVAWSNQTDDAIGFFGGGDLSSGGGLTSTIDWLGSIRARAGFDAGNYMPYLTAGLAAAHNTLDLTSGGTSGPDPVEPMTFSDEATHVGWTIGAGVEFAATDSLSIDVGYRYTDYGTADYTAPMGDTEAGTELPFALTSHQLTVGLHYGF